MPNPNPAGLNAFTLSAILVLGVIAVAVAMIDTGGSLLTSSPRS